MAPRLNRAECMLLAWAAALLATAVLGPPLAQSPGYHGFADARTLWGVPRAMDVLSNAAFAAFGLWGGWRLLRLPPGALTLSERWLCALFFVGLIATAAASAVYHLEPHDAGLAIDRAAMGLAFAGILGLATLRVSARAGWATAIAVLLLAPLAVHAWLRTGNLLPWAALQLGGMLALLALPLARPCAPALPVRWGVLLAAYALAKLLEAADQAIFQLSAQTISGHTLKHLTAAAAAWPVVAALGARMPAPRGAPRPAAPAAAAGPPA